MILFDNSGSMSDTVPASGYASSTTYSTPLDYSTNKVYRKYTSKKDCKPNPKPCYKVYTNTVAQVNSTAARTALSTVRILERQYFRIERRPISGQLS